MKASSRLPNNPLVLAAFIAVVIFGGSNAVAVRFSNFDLPPFWGAAARFGSAALIFWIISLARRLPLPPGKVILMYFLYGALSIGASSALLYWSLTHVQASLSMVVLASVPLVTLLFALLHRLESFRGRALAGAVIAMVGLLVGIGSDLGGAVPVPTLLALIGAAACIAEGNVIFKLLPRIHPLVANAIAFSSGWALLQLTSLAFGETLRLPASPTTWTAFLYLVLVGSVGMFYLYLFVLTRWTASATSYVFLLNPIAAIIMGSWLAGEVITPQFLAGTAIVMSGVYLGALSTPAPAPAPAESS